MNLRTYRARTMGDCLAEVKKDLGKDAVILHTRTFKVGGVLGLGSKSMVEVTASDGPATPRKPRNTAALKAYGVGKDQRLISPDASATSAAARVEIATLAAPRAVKATEAAPVMVETKPAEPKPTFEVRAVETRTAEPRVPELRAAEPRVGQQMTEELAAIRRMVGQVLQCSRQTALRMSGTSAGFGPADMPESLFQHYVRLLEGEVAAEIADEVVARVRAELPPAQVSDPDSVREAVIRYLAAMIPSEGDAAKLQLPQDGRPLTVAVVGPTGVGKTTTVAKLAATYKLRHGKRVGLVTSDTYRIAAVDQLRTYAEIIGLPLKVAMSPADMSGCCHSLSDCDIILIDTAGRSPRDSGRLDELRQFIAAARPHQTHLVLSSVSSEAVLMETAQRFLPVKPDRVIFTKLDEAVNFGVLITVARKIALRLSYVTTGQEVPDHIENGRPDRLARLLLEGSQAATVGAGSGGGGVAR